MGKTKQVTQTGRPSKYYEEDWCALIVKYFKRPVFIEREERIIQRNGQEKIVTKRELNPSPPFIAGFCATYQVDRSTLLRWSDQHEEFHIAYNEAKCLQEQWLITAGLTGAANSSFAIFTAKNVLGWRDRQDLEVKQAATPKLVIDLGQAEVIEDQDQKQIKDQE